MSQPQVNVIQYLYTRLHQLGVRALHGLPGDFNLLALDYVESSGLRWVGNANELNAGASSYPYTLSVSALTGTRLCRGWLRAHQRYRSDPNDLWRRRAVCHQCHCRVVFGVRACGTYRRYAQYSLSERGYAAAPYGLCLMPPTRYVINVRLAREWRLQSICRYPFAGHDSAGGPDGSFEGAGGD